MNRKESGDRGLYAIMTDCRSGWNRLEKQGKARMPFIRETGINCTPLCMESCGKTDFADRGSDDSFDAVSDGL